jgi:hypothetical protein
MSLAFFTVQFAVLETHQANEKDGWNANIFKVQRTYLLRVTE